MSETFDACVIGLGALGAATCLELARRGARVLGIERFDLAHALGSSGGPNRLIRKAYFEHPAYVPLLQRTYQGWDRIGAELGVPLLHRSGLLYLGPEDGPLLSGVRRARDAHALEVEALSAQQATQRFPQFRPGPDQQALFEPEGGYLLAEAAVAGMARLALEHGAVLAARERVLGWDADAADLRVRTERREIRARRLVIAPGPFAGALLSDVLRGLGTSLTVTRQAVGFVAPHPGGAFDAGRFPCFAIEVRGYEGIYYGFPRLCGAPAMKVARHVQGRAVDPEQLDRGAPTDADEADFRPLFAYLPEADGPLLAMNTCLYTMSADGHFIVDLAPHDRRIALAFGFSGHGFKFAPVIGEALADLVLTGGTELPIGFLGLARLGRA